MTEDFSLLVDSDRETNTCIHSKDPKHLSEPFPLKMAQPVSAASARVKPMTTCFVHVPLTIIIQNANIGVACDQTEIPVLVVRV